MLTNEEGQLPNTRPTEIDLNRNPYYFKGFLADCIAVLTDSFESSHDAYQQLKALLQILQKRNPDRLIWSKSTINSEQLPKISADSQLSKKQRETMENQLGPLLAKSSFDIEFLLPNRLIEYLFDHYFDDLFSSINSFKTSLYQTILREYQAVLPSVLFLLAADPDDHERDHQWYERLSRVDVDNHFTQPAWLGMSRHQATSIWLGHFSLDPLSSSGISSVTIDFLEILVFYLLAQSLTNDQLSFIDLSESVEAVKEPTKFDRSNALSLLNDLIDFTKDNDFPHVWLNSLQTLKTQFVNHHLPYDQMSKQEDSFDFSLKQSKAYQQARIDQVTLNGFQNYDFNTQLLLSNSYASGIYAQVLSKPDRLVALYHRHHHAIIKAGVLTKHANGASLALLQNKMALKRFMANFGFQVPSGNLYSDFKNAGEDFEFSFKHRALAVKPNVPKGGTGVTVFKRPANFELFKTAFQRASSEDKRHQVLIEEFIPGDVYRFLIVQGKLIGILNCVPANVIGDGKRSVSKLIARKNQEKSRGVEFSYPLHILTMDDSNWNYLKQQHIDQDSVLGRGQQLFLTNVSSWQFGSDYLNVIDEVDQSYQDLALQMAKQLDLSTVAIDLIIENSYRAYESQVNSAVFIDAAIEIPIGPFLFPKMGEPANPSQAIIKSAFQK